MLYREFLQRTCQLDHVFVEDSQRSVFHPILSINLFYDEFGIGKDFYLSRPYFNSFFKAGNDCPVFRLIIGGLPDAA